MSRGMCRRVLHPRQPLLNCDYMSVGDGGRGVWPEPLTPLLRPVRHRHTDTPLDFLPLFQRSIFKRGRRLAVLHAGGGGITFSLFSLHI
jgi:hypothetical protein